MSAASVAPVPLFRDGNEYWQELVSQCKQRVESINGAASSHGYGPDELVNWFSGAGIQLTKSGYPSTRIKAFINFQAWGPMICGVITGDQDSGLKFSAEEFEIPIARDLDGAIVGIFEEGRSFSPHDLACYLTQNFRRCYPGVSLPC